jgi:protein ImuB
MTERRFAAIVLPELACELARIDGLVPEDRAPFAVMVAGEASAGDEIDRTAMLDAVDVRAWQFGARPGQTAVEACAFVSKLRIVRLPARRVEQALGAVAEMALGHGTTAALDLDAGDRIDGSARCRYPLGAGAGPRDTVWLDVTGCARLVGGEDVLCAELRERVQALGHRARVAIAGGPRVAQAVARWWLPRPGAESEELVVPAEATARRLAELPVMALPLDPALYVWLGKLGILRIADLVRLERSRLAHRLGPAARDLLQLCAGRDDVPLRAWEPPRRIVESAAFEDPLDGLEPLMFVLRRLIARAAARLGARGEACTTLGLALAFDPSVIALQNRNALHDENGAALTAGADLALSLPIPLAREDELVRPLHARLERLEVPAPIRSVTLVLDGLTARPEHQLALDKKRGRDPGGMPRLLGELEAWLGPGRVGVLRVLDAHRPEMRSALVTPGSDAPAVEPPIFAHEPTRVLPEPIEVGRLERGALLASHDGHVFLVDGLRLSSRFDGVEWWLPHPLSRDYARARLRIGSRPEPTEHTDGWVFVDRTTGRGYLHGFYD